MSIDARTNYLAVLADYRELRNNGLARLAVLKEKEKAKTDELGSLKRRLIEAGRDYSVDPDYKAYRADWLETARSTKQAQDAFGIESDVLLAVVEEAKVANDEIVKAEKAEASRVAEEAAKVAAAEREAQRRDAEELRAIKRKEEAVKRTERKKAALVKAQDEKKKRRADSSVAELELASAVAQLDRPQLEAWAMRSAIVIAELRSCGDTQELIHDITRNSKQDGAIKALEKLASKAPYAFGLRTLDDEGGDESDGEEE